jgi:hypothetical protein
MACALGSPQPVPSIKPVAASQVGAPIHISEWKTDPAWTRNGSHPSVGTLSGEICTAVLVATMPIEAS